MTEHAPTTAYENYDLKAEAPGAKDPAVRFAFEFPELLALFREIDVKAVAAKEASRRSGYAAVFLVLAALLLASATPLLTVLDEHTRQLLGYLSTAMGIGGTVLGLASLRRGSARRVWLRHRLQTETLRLFHFHYIAARLPEICLVKANPAREAAYLADRAAALEQLKAGRLADPAGELARIAEHADSFGFDDATPPMAAAGKEDEHTAEQVFTAWRQLRFDWQLGYCEAKLAHRATKGRASSHQVERRFIILTWSCLAAVLALHVLQVSGQALGIETPWLEVAVVWVALVALAGRALEDGLQPQREVERYEQYRANIKVAAERLDGAASFVARLEVIRAFERTSLEETRVFMRTHARARFLL
jgi:hypothetical protein